MTSLYERMEAKALRIKQLEFDEAELRSQAEAITREAAKLAQEAAKLKQEIIDKMEECDFKAIKGKAVEIAITKNKWSVASADVDKLPSKYQRVNVTVNKAALLQDREHVHVDGVVFKQGVTLTIKKVK